MSYGEVVLDSGTRPMTEAEMLVRIADLRQELAQVLAAVFFAAPIDRGRERELRQELGALIRLVYGPHTAPYEPQGDRP